MSRVIPMISTSYFLLNFNPTPEIIRVILREYQPYIKTGRNPAQSTENRDEVG